MDDLPLETRARPDAGLGAVTRRRVLYVHGFDPRGPAHYHRLFIEQAALQSKLNGAEISVGPRRRNGRNAAWSIDARFGAAATATTYEFLRWDKEVRALWTRSGPRMLAEMWASNRELRRKGVFRELKRTAWPFCAAVLLPVVAISLFQATALIATLLLGFAAFAVARALGVAQPIAVIAAIVVLPGPVWLAWTLWRRFDTAFRTTWLLRAATCYARGASGRCAEMEQAAERLADDIAAAVAEPGWDEMLLVAHSHGAALAIMALARALRRDPQLASTNDGRPRLSLLTLAQALAAWDYVSQGGGFHADLATIAAAEQIPWLDVTSPSDGAATGRLDPLKYVEAAPGRVVRRWPHFHLILTPERFRRTRFRQFDYHFLYLGAADVGGGYDFFRLVCGPDRLMDFAKGWVRFEGLPE